MAYVATITLLLEVYTEAEAMDAVAETMRPLLHTNNPLSCIRDWMYADAIDYPELQEIGSIPSDFYPDNEWPWALNREIADAPR